MGTKMYPSGRMLEQAAYHSTTDYWMLWLFGLDDGELVHDSTRTHHDAGDAGHDHLCDGSSGIRLLYEWWYHEQQEVILVLRVLYPRHAGH